LSTPLREGVTMAKGFEQTTKQMVEYLEKLAGKTVSAEELGIGFGLNKEQVQGRMIRVIKKGEHPIEVVKAGNAWRWIKIKGRGGPRRPQPELVEETKSVEKDLDEASLAEKRIADRFVQPSWTARLDSVEGGLKIAYTVMGHSAFMQRLAYILVSNDVPDFNGKG
jgi:hypothetical protein